MAVSSCTFYDDYIEHAIEDMVIFGQIVAKSHFVTEFFLRQEYRISTKVCKFVNCN